MDGGDHDRRGHDPSACDHCRRNAGASTGLFERPAWVADAVFYQIFPDRFARSERVAKPANLEPWDAPPTVHGYKGGDLLGIVDRLGWLGDLGVTAIYLNPIFQSAANHRYHPHDYLQIDPLLGDEAAFDELLGACHARGIRVVLDGVFNHASRGFFAFSDILENGASSPWVDWFTVHEFPPNAYDESRPPGYQAWWGLHALPKLNTENPEVREYLMGVGEHWMRRGIDGWRLDVPQEIATPGFWEEFRERVRAVNPEAYIVGEIWEPATDWIGASPRFDGVMNYQLTEAALRFAAGTRIDHEITAPVNLTLAPHLDGPGMVASLERLLGLYPDDAHRSNLNLLGSHDTPRVLSMVGSDPASVRLATTVLFTMPGAPCIYYGDEIGMSGPHDPGSRAAFPWEQPDTWDKELLDHHRGLIRLRHDEPTLRWGSMHSLTGGGPMIVFIREHEGDRLVVAVNAGDAETQLTVEMDDVRSAEGRWGSGEAVVIDGHSTFSVPPRAAGVWRLHRHG